MLNDLYLAGDTVWYDGVAETIASHRPRVAVVNAGGAEFAEGGLIVMGVDDVREVAARVPTVVAVHMEALNHCHLTRPRCARRCPACLFRKTARRSSCSRALRPRPPGESEAGDLGIVV